MSGHAKLSPSAADRWMTCPGSVVLSEGMPEKTSGFAEEGTKAHELAQMLLENHSGTMDCPEGMLDNVRIYVDHVRSLHSASPKNQLHVEQRVWVNEDVYGTADAIVWQEADRQLHVVDLKYGAGVPVEVQDNLQLRIYALAALRSCGYPARKVTTTIVQPRCPHPDGPVRSITFDVVDLYDLHADIEDAIHVVRDASSHAPDTLLASGFLRPSEKGCRWCLAAPKCPALKKKAQEMAAKVFAPGTAYDPLELARTLDFLPILEGWIKNTREFAYSEAEKGTVIPDWKLVEKRAVRKWRDEKRVEEWLLSQKLLPDEIYEQKVKSVAQIEKIFGKGELPEDLVAKESSGHTLVHESDKRPAIKVDAKSAFATS